MNKTVISAALGEFVHVTGVSNFLRLVEIAGWRTVGKLGIGELTRYVTEGAQE